MLSVRRRQEDARGVGARGAAAGGMEDDAELEEAEACGDDTAFLDPDVALSYIDEKLQDVLGHFQKDFEGGVSAETLGSKFGGYGSFLPTYQRSPLPQTRSPPKVANLSSRSPYHQSTEGMSQNPSVVAVPSISQNNGSVVPFSGNSSKREHCQSTNAEKGSITHDSLYGPSKCSDQNRFKVWIKVGSENVLARNNAAIYSGLGLDISSPSSMEDSPFFLQLYLERCFEATLGVLVGGQGRLQINERHPRDGLVDGPRLDDGVVPVGVGNEDLQLTISRWNTKLHVSRAACRYSLWIQVRHLVSWMLYV